MKKVLLAAVLGLALCVAPSVAFAAPPGYYYGNRVVTPYSPVTPFATGPTVSGYNAYSSPYGYSTVNNYSITPTPFGLAGYNTYSTYVRPYYSGPVHSVYWNPYANTYQYGPGYLNSGTGYGYFSLGW
jgi:hypothetical protein